MKRLIALLLLAPALALAGIITMNGPRLIAPPSGGGDPDPEPGDVPAYIADLEPFEVRSLTGSYAATNGTTTVAALLTAAGWSNTDIIRPWSGGAKSTSGTKLWVHGGGHNDSDNNAMVSYDFAGDAAPTGFVLENAGQSGVTGDFTVGTTGYPVSVHTYDGLCDMGDAIYRFGGSSHPSGGFTGQMVRFDKDTQTWTRIPNTPWTNFAGSCIGNPAAGKILAMERWATFFTYAFYRVATNDWGTRRDAAAQWPNDGVCAWDPSTDGGLCVANNNGFGVNAFSITINWSAETITQTARDIDNLGSGPSIVFDPDLGVYWCWGGDGQDSYIYEIDPTDWSATQHELGTALSPEGGSHGHFGRFVFLREWRAIGVISDRNDPAIVIRLPPAP